MKDIIISALTLGLLSAIARIALPYSEKFVTWLIGRFVKRAEKKIQGSKMGAQKKAYVLQKTQAFSVQSTDFLNNLIDTTVEALNNKVTDTQTTLKADITEQIETDIESASKSIKSNLSKK
jgi:hypothetical protein